MVWREKARQSYRSKQGARSKAAQEDYGKLKRQQATLRQEVMKSLNGESVFEAALINSMLQENIAELKEAEARVSPCEQEKAKEDIRLQYLSEQYKQITDWAKEFDLADNDTKKMIMARLNERIAASRNYKLTIKFFVSLEDFVQIDRTDLHLVQSDNYDILMNNMVVL